MSIGQFMPMVAGGGRLLPLYETNFSEYEVGKTPYDWTVPGDHADFLVQEIGGSISGKGVAIPANPTLGSLSTWRRVPEIYNCEILLGFQGVGAINSTSPVATLFSRYHVTGGGINVLLSMATTWNTNPYWSHQTAQYVDGVYTSLGSITGLAPAYTANAWAWFRVRVVGNQMYSKLWRRDRDEPSTYRKTDTVTAPIKGLVGIARLFPQPRAANLDYFAVSTGDNPAIIPVPS